MMKRALFSCVLALTSATSAFAEVETWNIDPNHTASQFSIRHMGISTVRGSFNKTTGVVQYDPKNPSATVIEATIDAGTINTRIDARDNDLRSATYFDVEKFPTITFKSKRVEANGAGKLKVTGDLTIKGVAKEVVLDVEGPGEAMKDPGGKVHMGASANTTVKRTDFGIGKPGPMLGEDVHITLDIEMIKAEAAAPAAK
jgi:polyisoprenoid-binding protein YceI